MESQPSDPSGIASALICSSKMLHLVPTQKSTGSGRCAVPPGHTAGKNPDTGSEHSNPDPSQNTRMPRGSRADPAKLMKATGQQLGICTESTQVVLRTGPGTLAQ